MRLFKTIKFRLTLWYVVVILVLLSIFATAAYLTLSREMYGNLDESLKERVTELKGSLKSGDSSMLFAGNVSELVLFYDSNKNLVQKLGPDINLINIDGLVESALLGQSSFMTANTQSGQEARLYAAPFVIDSANQDAIVVGRNLGETQGILRTFGYTLGISALVIIVLVGVGGAFLASRTLKPVDRMTGTAQHISETDLSRRIDVKSEDELGRLGVDVKQDDRTSRGCFQTPASVYGRCFA